MVTILRQYAPPGFIEALDGLDFDAARKAAGRSGLGYYSRIQFYRLATQLETQYEDQFRACYEYALKELDKPSAEGAPPVEFIRKSNSFKLWDAYDPNQFEPWDDDILADTA